jgi:hypothetical protein
MSTSLPTTLTTDMHLADDDEISLESDQASFICIIYAPLNPKIMSENVIKKQQHNFTHYIGVVKICRVILRNIMAVRVKNVISSLFHIIYNCSCMRKGFSVRDWNLENL